MGTVCGMNSGTLSTNKWAMHDEQSPADSDPGLDPDGGRDDSDSSISSEFCVCVCFSVVFSFVRFVSRSKGEGSLRIVVYQTGHS